MIAKQLIIGVLVMASGSVSGEQDSNRAAAKPASFAARGTWNGVPIATTLIQRYESDRQAHFINFTPADSNQILGLLSRHVCDVGMTFDFRLSENAIKTAGCFENHTIGWLVVGVAINAKSPMRTISLDDLQGVFTGKITSWEDVSNSGVTGRVEVFQPMTISTQGMLFQQKVLLGRQYVGRLLDTSTTPDGRKKSDAKVGTSRGAEVAAIRHEKQTDADVIGAVIKQSKAIGFILYPCDSHLDKRIRILRIAKDKNSKPVLPTTESLADGSYPLADTLTLYLHPDAPPAAREFCKFATGPEGAKIIKQFGLWPEYELEKERGKQRLADVKAGKGTEIAIYDLTNNENVLQDMATEFVKAKAAVQLKFQKERTAADLLLMDGDSGSANLKSVELGRMAVGVVVHPENPLDSLPIDEARDIFTGKIKKWPAVRGAAPVMHVFGLKQSDSIAQLLKEKLALTPGPSPNEARGVEKPLHYVNQPSSEKVILAVARDPAAIGFVDLSQLPENEKSVKRVKVTVGQKDPRSTNIWYDDNPLARTLTLYVSPKASQTAKDFAEFLTPEHCKEIIAKYNLLPPLHVDSQLADTRPRETGDEPPQLVLDEPETVKKPVKTKKPVEEPKPVATVAEKPQRPAVKFVADDEPADTTQEKKQPGVPTISSEQTVWLVGGVVGVIALSLGIGWLRSPHRKRPRR